MNATNAPSHEEVVDQELKALRHSIANFLPSVETTGDFSLAVILMCYRNIIAPNFVPWMAYIWIWCQGQARKDLAENIRLEIYDDHPEMLVRYVAQIGGGSFLVSPRASRFSEKLESVVDKITLIARGRDTHVGAVLVAAALENTSLEFIPWMKAAGMKLGFTDFEYVDKHGEADIEHASSLAEAIVSESKANRVSTDQLAVTCKNIFAVVEELLKGIFTAE